MKQITLPNQSKFHFDLSIFDESMKVSESVEKTEYRHGGAMESATNEFSLSAKIIFTKSDSLLGEHLIDVTGEFYTHSFDGSCSQGAMVHTLESETLNLQDLLEQERFNFFHALGVCIYMYH